MSSIDGKIITIRANIENYASVDAEQLEQLCKLLSHRQKYAKFYLEAINVDKDATIIAIDQVNVLIKHYLGL